MTLSFVSRREAFVQTERVMLQMLGADVLEHEWEYICSSVEWRRGLTIQRALKVKLVTAILIQVSTCTCNYCDYFDFCPLAATFWAHSATVPRRLRWKTITYCHTWKHELKNIYKKHLISKRSMVLFVHLVPWIDHVTQSEYMYWVASWNCDILSLAGSLE